MYLTFTAGEQKQSENYMVEHFGGESRQYNTSKSSVDLLNTKSLYTQRRRRA